MANKMAAAKYIRASQRRRLRNKPVRSRARTTVRDAQFALSSGDLNESEPLIRDALVALDRAAQSGVIHANNAARRKSRLLRQLHRARNPEATRRPKARPPEPVKVP